jgi:hypothetical protein
MYMICALAGAVEGPAAGELKVEDESQYEDKGGARGAGGAAGAAGDVAGGGAAGGAAGAAESQTDKFGESAELKKKERTTFAGTQFPCFTSTKVQILTRLRRLS